MPTRQAALKPGNTNAEIAIVAIVFGGVALVASMYGAVLLERRRRR